MPGKYETRNAEGDHRIKDDDHSAIALLKAEHHVFRKLFDEAETASQKRLAAISRELCMRLAVHMTIEEEIIYPALRAVGEADEIDEGVVEHASGKRICAELEQLDGTEPLFKAKVHVLGEETVHHIDEEDEELFEDAKAAHDAGKLDLDEIGGRLRARQAELYDQIAADGELGDTDEADADEVVRV